MSRSIVRSKINSKYNPVQTGGGGGGSAIAVYNEAALLTANVTSFTFTGLGIDATAAGNAVTVTVNNNEVIEVKNATGSTIPKGAVCYINVLGGSGTHPEILLASAATESTSSKTIGVTADAITPGSIGLLIINGEITGTGAAPLDTSAYNAGALLWLSNTAGQWTTTIPSFPSHAVFIGHVTRSQTTNGRVVIKIQNGYEVQELHDAVIGSKVHGQFLMVDTITYAPNTAWINQRLVSLVTVSQLTTLRNNNQLIPGMTYWITNAPIISYAAVGTAYFFIKAVYSDALEGCGSLEVLVSGPPNTYRSIDCWYDLNTNTHQKISDPYNRNTVEGWANIQAFLNMCGSYGGIFSGSIVDNSIVNGSAFIFPSTITGLTTFSGNYIDGSIFTIDNVTIPIIENNTLINSSLILQGSVISRLSGNYLEQSTISDAVGLLTTLLEFKYNYLEKSSVVFEGADPGLIEFQNNRLNHSSIVLNNIDTLSYLNENFIDTSTINLIGSSTVVASIIQNVLNKTLLQLNEAQVADFVSNSCTNSVLSISGAITGSGNITYNSIDKSNIENTDCELVHCNIFGMGAVGTVSMNTTTSYNYCNYRLYEDSTFYVRYDIDGSDIPVSNFFIIPTGHETWIGKITFYSTLGGGTYNLKTIYNPIINHRYYIYKDAGVVRFDLDVSTGFFVMPLSAAGVVQLDTAYDYTYFDPRPDPIGIQTGGEHVLISYGLY